MGLAYYYNQAIEKHGISGDETVQVETLLTNTDGGGLAIKLNQANFYSDPAYKVRFYFDSNGNQYEHDKNGILYAEVEEL